MRELLEKAECPVVLCSFGKDSLLLLHKAREIKPDINILWLKEDTTQQQWAKKYIRDNDLKVYSYAPVDKYYLPEGEELVLVHEYDTGTERLSVLLSLEHSDQCGLQLSKKRTQEFFWPWDLALVGWKKTDDPSIALSLPRETKLTNTKVVAPLYDMTDDEVWAEIDARGIPHPPKKAGDAQLCTNCIKHTNSVVFCPLKGEMIPTYQWDKEAALRAFQKRLEQKSE